MSLTWAADFTVTSGTSPAAFISKLQAALGLAAPPSYRIKNTDTGAGATIEVSFADQATRDRAMNLGASTKQDLGITGASAIDNGAPATTASPGGEGGSNVIIIAAAAAGGVVLLAIVAVIIYKRRSGAGSPRGRAAGDGTDRSGAIHVNYEAMMGDTFADQEELSPSLRHYSQAASV